MELIGGQELSTTQKKNECTYAHHLLRGAEKDQGFLVKLFGNLGQEEDSSATDDAPAESTACMFLQLKESYGRFGVRCLRTERLFADKAGSSV